MERGRSGSANSGSAARSSLDSEAIAGEKIDKLFRNVNEVTTQPDPGSFRLEYGVLVDFQL